MKVENILLTVAVVLGLFSLINIQWEIMPHRWLRICTSVIFFLLAIIILGFRKIWGLSIFLSLIFCDLLLLKWEVPISKYIYYSLHSLIILSLILLAIRGMEWRKISWLEVGFAILFLIFSSFIFLALGEFLNIEDILLKILFSINGFVMVTLVVFSFFQKVNDSGPFGSSFFLGVSSLIVSELILFIIYFLEVSNFRYLDNFFYVAGLFFLLKVSLENKLLQQSYLVLKEKEGEGEVQDSSNGVVYR